MVVVIQFQLCALFPSFHDIAEQDDLIRFTYYLLLLLLTFTRTTNSCTRTIDQAQAPSVYRVHVVYSMVNGQSDPRCAWRRCSSYRASARSQRAL